MKKLFCCRKRQEVEKQPKRFGLVKKTVAIVTIGIAAALLGYGRKRQKSLSAVHENVE